LWINNYNEFINAGGESIMVELRADNESAAAANVTNATAANETAAAGGANATADGANATNATEGGAANATNASAGVVTVNVTIGNDTENATVLVNETGAGN
jgi:hypothetical protein